MRRSTILPLLAASVALAVPSLAASPGDPPSGAAGSLADQTAPAKPLPAVTRPLHDLELAFATAGRIEAVPVRLGDRVAAGALLVQLDDDELTSQVELLALRANDDSAITAAKAGFEAADDLFRRTRSAFEGQSANVKELTDAQLRATKAKADLLDSQREFAEAKLQLAQFRVRLDRMRLVAPFAGRIEAVAVEPGGAIDELAPAIRLVDTSAVKIDLSVPTDQTFALRVGQTMTVRYRGIDRAPGTATIVSLADVADAASKTRVIRLEMPNPEGLPAGLPVEVTLPPAVGGSLATASSNSSTTGDETE
jgi:RND family efflux transporter MFP subunit